MAIRALTLGEIEKFEDAQDVGVFGLLRTILRGDAILTSHALAIWHIVNPSVEWREDPIRMYGEVEAILVKTLVPAKEAEEILAVHESRETPDPDPTSGPGE